MSWILSHPSKPVVILGTNQMSRISSALGAIDVSLNNQQWFSLWQASVGQEVP